MPSKVEIDRSRFPIVLLKYGAEGFSDAEFRDHLDDIVGITKEGHPIAFISDIQQSPPPPATQRRMMADMLREHADSFSSACRGWAQVTSSSLTRGILTAVSWLQKSPMPTRVFSAVEEAQAWCDEQLRR